MCRLSTIEKESVKLKTRQQKLETKNAKIQRQTKTEQNYQELRNNVKHFTICTWHLIRKRERKGPKKYLGGKAEIFPKFN